jgi:hypothetical protein
MSSSGREFIRATDQKMGEKTSGSREDRHVLVIFDGLS